MKRVAAGLLGLMLVGCQQIVVTPEPLPTLRESALGLTLNLSGPVDNWPAGEVADIALFRYPGPPDLVGSVSGEGVFNLSITAKPDFYLNAVDVLIGALGESEQCRQQEIKISDASVRASELRLLPLTQPTAAPLSVRPQTSPPVTPPGLVRRKDDQEVRLLYVDRDLRVEGTRICAGQFFYGGKFQRATSINVQLRAGWNFITVNDEYLGPKDGTSPDIFPYRLTVQGGDALPGTAWTYNRVPLNR